MVTTVDSNKTPRFSLWISDEFNAQLLRTEFYHPLLGRVHHTVRGKDAPSYFKSSDGPVGSFQWTSAVKALCQLVVQATHSNNPLSGEKDSPALSLGYAISKQNLWLVDMFGVDSAGNPLTSRLFQITNRNLKRAGPITIGLNINFLPTSSIKIYVAERQINEPAEFLALLHILEPDNSMHSCSGHLDFGHHLRKPGAGSTTQNSKTSQVYDQYMTPEFLKYFNRQHSLEAVPYPFSDPIFKKHMHKAFIDELNLALNSFDIFSSSGMKQCLDQIVGNSWYKKICGKKNLISELDLNLSKAERLGFGNQSSLDEAFKKAFADEPLVFHNSGAGIAELSVLYYIKYIRELPVENRFLYHTSIDIAQKVLNGGIEGPNNAITLSIGNASPLLSSKHKDYLPLMFMTPNSFRLIGRSDNLKEGGEVSLYTGENATSQHLYHDLLGVNGFNKHNLTAISNSPEELTSIAREFGNNSWSIMWFPFSYFNMVFNSLKLVDSCLPLPKVRANLLFVPKSFYEEDNKALILNLLIRDAWLKLREHKELAELITLALVEDRMLMRFLSRCAGLFRVPSTKLESLNFDALCQNS